MQLDNLSCLQCTEQSSNLMFWLTQAEQVGVCLSAIQTLKFRVFRLVLVIFYYLEFEGWCEMSNEVEKSLKWKGIEYNDLTVKDLFKKLKDIYIIDSLQNR